MDIVLVFYILGSIIYNILMLLLSPVLISSHIAQYGQTPRSGLIINLNSLTDKNCQAQVQVPIPSPNRTQVLTP